MPPCARYIIVFPAGLFAFSAFKSGKMFLLPRVSSEIFQFLPHESAAARFIQTFRAPRKVPFTLLYYTIFPQK